MKLYLVNCHKFALAFFTICSFPIPSLKAISFFQFGLECEPVDADDETWTGMVNRGGLVNASDAVKENVRKINAAFNLYHRDTLMTGRDYGHNLRQILQLTNQSYTLWSIVHSLI